MKRTVVQTIQTMTTVKTPVKPPSLSFSSLEEALALPGSPIAAGSNREELPSLLGVQEILSPFSIGLTSHSATSSDRLTSSSPRLGFFRSRSQFFSPSAETLLSFNSHMIERTSSAIAASVNTPIHEFITFLYDKAAAYGLLEAKPYSPLFQTTLSDSVQQLGDLSKDFSDHLMFLLKIPGLPFNALVLDFNAMMQAFFSTRPNTAFGETEDPFSYRVRIRTYLNFILEVIRHNPELAMITLQEAPIKEHWEYMQHFIEMYFPEEWKLSNPNIHADHTHWGVCTIFNVTKLQSAPPKRIDDFTKSLENRKDIKDIAIRCRTFEVNIPNSNVRYMANGHFQHNKPELACKAYFEQALLHIAKQIECKYQQALAQTESKEVTDITLIEEILVICADFNLSPRQIDQIFTEIMDEYNQKNLYPPISVDVEIHVSLKGHCKYQDPAISTPRPTVDVDAVVSVKVRRSEERRYTLHYENIAAIALATMMLGIHACTSITPTRMLRSPGASPLPKEDEYEELERVLRF